MPEFVEEYDKIRRNMPHGWRARGRDFALDLLSAGMDATIGFNACFAKPRIQFLYIHHVFKDEEKQLAILLKALSEKHTFISYSEAWTRLLQGDVDKPYIAFSSDDGLKNNLKAAAILKEHGASACFFVCPSMVGEKDINKIQQFSEDRLHFPPVEFMDWEDVAHLQNTGHEIGSHTMSHINVARTPQELLFEEIADSKRILDEKCGNIIHFAYPYGRHFHFSSAGRKIVFQQGYLSCASAERGCHIVPPGGMTDKEQLLIRRDHIILDWPMNHIRYFLARNAMKADIKNNFFPEYADRHSDQ
jgi:peptidoglycan/xylan/chitin deacetylase (PgdA/CDA1 family)